MLVLSRALRHSGCDCNQDETTPMSDYTIRPLTAAELQHAVNWAGREGWNPGKHDAECFRTTDPEGFLGGFLDGEMIASVSAVNYDEAFSFLGFYIVRPEFRGSGHGLEIAQHALTHCTGRNMGLEVWSSSRTITANPVSPPPTTTIALSAQKTES
ncbi:GNAT family N-acetyltransferase [uncultured Ruegeria sp.]|uniref:GNAT family N-acetyltransferase n=1 Tax=uncultured Ruegeria sp. TaxID=259304 RepID=UPI0026174329|nr:GNAT family N-acetyltransferase [uncultured Ruegeria sp.]